VSSRVAANCTNTFQCKKLWMCRLSFAGIPQQTKPDAPKEAEKEDPDTWFDKYMNGLKVEPLKEAYVLLVPTSSGQASVAPNACSPILCRTGQDGEILKIQEREVESCVPNSDIAHWMLFGADSTYSYFWTFSKRIFKNVVREAKADIENVICNYEFGGFIVSNQERPPYESSDKRTWELMERPAYDLLQPFLITSARGSSYPGTYPGHLILYDLHHACKKPQTPNIAFDRDYLFARCDMIDSIYLAELVHYHAMSLRQKTIKDFAVFKQIEDICQMAEERETIPGLEFENTSEVIFARHIKSQPSTRKAFLDYAFDCAERSKEEIDVKLFSLAIDVLPTDGAWARAANEIYQKFKIVHPCADENGLVRDFEYFQATNTAPVIHYFEFYRFANEQSAKQWYRNFLPFTENNIESRLKAIQAELRDFLGRHIPWDDLITHMDTHCEADLCKRCDLNARFLDLAVSCHYRWWEHLHLDSEDLWKKREPDWEWTGELPHKAGELLTHHFGTLETVQKYNEILEQSEEAWGRMFKELARLNKRMGGLIVKRKLPNKVTGTADFAKGTIVVMEDGRKVTTLHFLKKVDTETVSVLKEGKVRAHAGPRQRKKIKQQWKKKIVKRTTYELQETHLKEFREWPEFLEAAGAFVSLTLSVLEIIEIIKGDEEKTTGEEIEAFAALGRDTCLFIASFSEALNSTFGYAAETGGMLTKFEKVGHVLKGPGLILEAAINVEQGSTILLLGEDSLSAQAVVKGDVIEGWLQEVKGLVLVASVVPGVVAAGSALLAGGTAAAVFAAALPPLGIALAIAALLVIAIDFGIYIFSEPESVMKPMEEALDKALKNEFGKDFLGQNERTYDSIRKFSVQLAGLLT